MAKVIVCFEKNCKLPIYLCRTEEEFKYITVGQLKGMIIERCSRIPYIAGEKHAALIYKAQALENTKTLAEYGIKHNSEIHYVRRCDGGGVDPYPPHPHTDDGLGDKEGETRRSKEYLAIPMSKTQNKFSVDPK